jgi:two-component system OmpR family response regulator
MALNILLAEDDDNLGMLLFTYLKSKNYKVHLVKDGKSALDKYRELEPDFCIFDVMMPQMDGFELAKEIRATDKKTPILFLTAKNLSEDKLEGFSSGADDYMTKPFQMEELLARIEAISRRTGYKLEDQDAQQMVGNIKYDTESRILFLAEGEKKLTTKENELLQMLVKNEGEILDRNATLRAIWGDDNYFNGRSMDVYIAKLRKLLKEDENIEILNVHGKGFKFLIKD